MKNRASIVVLKQVLAQTSTPGGREEMMKRIRENGRIEEEARQVRQKQEKEQQRLQANEAIEKANAAGIKGISTAIRMAEEDAMMRQEKATKAILVSSIAPRLAHLEEWVAAVESGKADVKGLCEACRSVTAEIKQTLSTR